MIAALFAGGYVARAVHRVSDGYAVLAAEAGFGITDIRSPDSKATILGNHDGFVKVVSDEKHGEILGVHIIGPMGYELISEAVAAMEAEATVETLMHTVHAHPTLYEALGEAFNAVEGMQINA